jgi:N-acetylglucosaminyl-diphospho-decaprenol L-rhamnosyltransferase
VPTVEVLIVSYNARDLLADCLRSLAQHLPTEGAGQVSVRVLDNASSDGSSEMIASLFPSVALECSPENLGFAQANNRLVNSSRSDYVMLLNPDTRWCEDLVTPLLKALQDSPQAVAVGPRLEWPDGRRQPSAQRFPTLSYEFAVAIQHMRYARLLRPLWDVDRVVNKVECLDMDLSRRQVTPSLWATCWLMRRTDLATLGLFDERYATYDEDVDFCRRMHARGRTFIYEPRVTLIHVGGGSSSPSVKQGLVRRGRHLYYKLHHGRTAAFAYASVLPALLRIDGACARLARRLVTTRRARA